ncbi:MAG: LysR family transcriptional regulator [Verrucomicrobia bacterium]|nr:MAG: LysR family transcriptional regulator [Verrucomicrobiota bacterium]
MNPHQLELFYHVAKSRGVTRATRQMPYGIQQPSVSAQVNALERDLGVTLYERRPFKLTPAGEELFRFVEPFFGRINEVRAKLQGAAQLRIGASPIVFRDYLPPVLEAIQRQFPRLNMILRALNQPELIDAIEHDELDVVISLIPDNLGPAFHAVDIMELPIILLVAKRSKIKSANDLWSHKRIAEPLISLKPNELICQLFQETLTNRGLSWLPKLEMDSLDLIERYVEKGFGVGLSIRAPGRTCPSTIRTLKLPDFPPVRLGVISRSESKHEPEVCHAFLEEVRRQAARFSPRKD